MKSVCIRSRALLSQQSRLFSAWKTVPLAPPDKILGLNDQFKSDTCRDKVNLGVGAYRDDSGKPVILPSVIEAEKRLAAKAKGHEYSSIQGEQGFIDESIKFAYGSDSELIKSGRIAAIQTLSGTGACRIAADFFSSFIYNTKTNKSMYIPNPTWGNHLNIIKKGGLNPEYYRYFDFKNRRLDLTGYLKDVEAAEEGSVFLLHACAHNPTGCDPSAQEWHTIADAMLKKKHVVFMDSAYQGFASGNAETDAYAIRHFALKGVPLVLAQSYAKNFGLYGQRIGTLSVVTESKEEKERVESQLKAIVRPMYSNPPVHGARLVQEILSTPSLRDQWVVECKAMADRIISMRSMLVNELKARGSTLDWSHITSQIGMFGYTGMTVAEVMKMREEFHIYCTEDGRISMAGVNSGNVKYVASAIHEVTKARAN